MKIILIGLGIMTLVGCDNENQGTQDKTLSLEEVQKAYLSLDNGAQFWNMATDEREAGNFSAAIKHVKDYIDVDGSDKANGYALLSDLYFELNDFNSCIEAATNSINENASGKYAVNAFNNRAHSNWKLDNRQLACEDWKKAADLGSESALNNRNKLCY
jgi:tetratricopeptide (TPR) repeat protein